MATSGLASHPEDYYELLGVQRGASADEIRKAYRQQALKWHPDKQDAANRAYAEARFKLISEAYQALSDTQKREAYDQFGQGAGRSSGGRSESEFSRGFHGFHNGFEGPGVRVVITRSGPGGTYVESRSGNGEANFHPLFRAGRDPLDLFREIFAEGPGMFHSRGRPLTRRCRGFGSQDADSADSDDAELQQALRLSQEEHQREVQRRMQEMQPNMDDEAALQEALRRSREESGCASGCATS